MELEQYNYSVEEVQENNLKDILIKYLFNWKWFLLSLILGFTLGFIYLRYHTPQYEVNATILIKDDKKGGMSDELSAFEDLGILKNNKNIDNEIEILKSRSLMTRVVKELNLNVAYYSFGRPIEHERYNDTPIKVSYTCSDSIKTEPTGNWVLIPESINSFILKNGDNNEVIGTYNFNEEVKTQFGKLIFSTTNWFTNDYLNLSFRVVISKIDEVVNNYLGSIKVNPVNKTSNAITISLRDAIAEKAADIVDNLIKQHNLDAISDKNQVSQNTANFINERIRFITSELSEVEGEAEDFKMKNRLTDVESEAKLFLQTGSNSEMNLVEASTQVKIAEYVNDYISKHDSPSDLIPSNLGLNDGGLSLQINDYNKLVLERKRLIVNSGERNPLIENLDAQIKELKMSIKVSLSNLLNTLQIKAKEISKKENEINAKISTVPKYEREYRTIQRQQQIKESLYLYLLQKREETNIALAVTVANAKIIDKAYSNGEMVAPNKKVIYLSSFLLGLILPIIVLYVIELLDTKVYGKKDTDKAKLPYLGDIPQSNSKNKLVVVENDRSNIAEGFRLLRTNVEFITGNLKNQSKCIFVTSTVGKEGKSFIALNLAASFALSGKKVLLIGTDLRAPKILNYLNLADRKGVTNYVAEGDLKPEELIFKMQNFNTFDVLPSGPIPPNPAELLMNSKMKELFDYAKANYEYVIVDTAPVGLVADTLLISEYADATVFVARAGVLDKRLLRIAESLNKEKRLPNMACLINGSNYRKG
ncbi:MAG: polysaccharide biosynthesis tyrosine autokinase, partial [Sphingobacteriaceae bacterium]|nr:polysaccharide biosynthesis tyrosine autokinase [Sphingobacteriaceae bacterium]